MSGRCRTDGTVTPIAPRQQSTAAITITPRQQSTAMTVAPNNGTTEATTPRAAPAPSVGNREQLKDIQSVRREIRAFINQDVRYTRKSSWPWPRMRVHMHVHQMCIETHIL